MDLPPSPLARPFPDIAPFAGVEVRTARAGYKDWDRADLTLITFPEGTRVAGVFTRSACPSYEVEQGREQRKRGTARAQVINAGNANAFTGERGREAVRQIATSVSEALSCDPLDVYVSSTGVIGVPLPTAKAQRGIEAALMAEPTSWKAAADAIGTTDTFAKGAQADAMVGDTKVTVAGIIKGSGMIAPDMATMLGYIVTDARVAPHFLQDMLERANAESFRCITVDGDTSTSDTVMLFATGSASHPELANWDSPGADAFYAALREVCLNLAHLVIRDGEGASKFIEIAVTGAVDDESARRIGLSIANSPLVKTAIAGGDANWGRIVMAVGKAGEPADRDRLSIAFGGIDAARNGLPCEGVDEQAMADHLAGQEIRLDVGLGLKDGRATVWTCDLTDRYIAINADYRS